MTTDVSEIVGLLVQVYWNITRRCWSVRDAKTRKVVAHMRFLALRDCTFVVSAAGRERVRRERRKNVHAWVQGTVTYTLGTVEGGKAVTYNPYTMETFRARNFGGDAEGNPHPHDTPVTKADYCEMSYECRYGMDKTYILAGGVA